MSTRWKLLVVAASSTAIILSGCARSPGERLIASAAAAKATAEAPIRLERQPDECGKTFELLTEAQMVGQEQVAIIKRYERMIAGPINDRIRNCFEFNQNVYRGLLR